jgi:hypothetical protein
VVAPVTHGHILPRPDGTREQCGGPRACPICQAELQDLERARRTQPHPPLTALRLAMYDLWHQRDYAGGPSAIERAAILAMATAAAEIQRLREENRDLIETQADQHAQLLEARR